MTQLPADRSRRILTATSRLKSFGAERTMTRLLPLGMAAVLLSVVFFPQLVTAAQASSHSTIDAHADTTGPIVVDSRGNGYVAWEHPGAAGHADTILFCKIPPGGTCTKPITLPLPGASGSEDAVTQPFPVLGGKEGVVYVVGPRYVRSDTIIWTSHNAGASFSAGQDIPPGSYAGNTNVDDVVKIPDSRANVDYFDVASDNVGLGYSFTGPEIASGVTSFTFGAGGVLGATLGVSNQEVVEAYWTDATTPTVSYYWTPYEATQSASAWKGPIEVSAGINARLAGGPGGLYLLSEDYSGGESQPSKLEVRKWNSSTHLFGAPTVVVDDTASTGSTSEGGLFENSQDGTLYVVWPGQTAKGAFVMRLWTSKTGGRSFSTAKDVATIAGGYAGPARIAMTNGRGFFTFGDFDGLQLVDLP